MVVVVVVVVGLVDSSTDGEREQEAMVQYVVSTYLTCPLARSGDVHFGRKPAPAPSYHSI